MKFNRLGILLMLIISSLILGSCYTKYYFYNFYPYNYVEEKINIEAIFHLIKTEDEFGAILSDDGEYFRYIFRVWYNFADINYYDKDVIKLYDLDIDSFYVSIYNNQSDSNYENNYTIIHEYEDKHDDEHNAVLVDPIMIHKEYRDDFTIKFNLIIKDRESNKIVLRKPILLTCKYTSETKWWIIEIINGV